MNELSKSAVAVLPLWDMSGRCGDNNDILPFSDTYYISSVFENNRSRSGNFNPSPAFLRDWNIRVAQALRGCRYNVAQEKNGQLCVSKIAIADSTN